MGEKVKFVECTKEEYDSLFNSEDNSSEEENG